MFEMVGILFGGISRLAQEWLSQRDAQKERDHEFRMFDKQVELMHKEIDTTYDLKQAETEFDALKAAIVDQTEEAKAAGGWVLKLSASVRPIISYWLLMIYSATKICQLIIAFSLMPESGTSQEFAQAFLSVYSQFDGALLGSIMSFWFVDRSLRHAGR